MKDYVISEETRAKLRGHRKTPESIAKMKATRAANLAQMTEKQLLEAAERKRIGAAKAGEKHRGMKFSDETRARMSVASKGKKKTEEHKLAMKLAWAKKRECAINKEGS